MMLKIILKKYDVIVSVKCKGNNIWVNGDLYTFKYPQVAKAVAKKISYFLNIK